MTDLSEQPNPDDNGQALTGAVTPQNEEDTPPEGTVRVRALVNLPDLPYGTETDLPETEAQAHIDAGRAEPV